ncbi:hypothetical protein VOLCADRAFT_106589 [Volvox carteri f. nagariensis]|uniref:Uncharacterized protein n=1 Tax=Volvox carteri f. nagariensis TaxID=3068 RepID=D8U8E1_VOLCA|nr:uncharacterized protein VOLCADRAFT_106589 [Volvox carteri f. nagariensis]EFJ43911.1 hypothetical protein VOLCADRAFT_106589 [Volvox carteri f. nagariensis]|eukprot:XP_002954923.1 hypothetical protein VOLCADRAFT_106589 [Volvox carteri f. nagariensis]
MNNIDNVVSDQKAGYMTGGSIISRAGARPMRVYMVGACIEHLGYVTLTGGVLKYKFDAESPWEPSWGDMFPNMTAAKSACDADSACIGFNSRGFTVTLAGLGPVNIEHATQCLYLKQVAPQRANYMMVPYLTWIGISHSSILNIVDNAEQAKMECESSACVAWSTDGRYMIGPLSFTEFVPSETGATMYLRPACMEKLGYKEKYQASTVVSMNGIYGMASGKMPSGKEAEQFCNLDYRCTGFSYDGTYVIGAAKVVFTYPGKCAYMKDPCAPMRGFAAYNDVNIKPMYSPSSRANQTALADVYQTCLADPSCRAFNNARYMWSTDWLVPELQESYVEDAPGICLYYKLS